MDVLQIVYDGADRLLHHYWHEWESGPSDSGANSDAVESHYRALDLCIGQLLGEFDSNRVIVYSDHGFGPLRTLVHIDRWLEEKGYARLSKHELSARSATRGTSLEGLAYRIGLGTRLKRVLPRTIKRAVARAPALLASKYEWSRTRAYFGSQPGQSIRINLAGREPAGVVTAGEDYERLRKELTGALMALTHPETGERLIDKVWTREEIFCGPHVEQADDLIVVPNDGVYLIGGHHPQLVRRAGAGSFPWTGCHRRDGIFILAGAGVTPDGIGLMANIIDVAPTVLYWLGIEIPQAIDGRVLLEAFSPEFQSAHPVRQGSRVATKTMPASPLDPEDEQETLQRLKDLGYLE